MENLRTFVKESVNFLHPDMEVGSAGSKPPKLKNVNLLLGSNGSGKTTMLKAIALSALSPIIKDSGFVPYCYVRKADPGRQKTTLDSYASNSSGSAVLTGVFYLHDEDVQKENRKKEFDKGKRDRTTGVSIAKKGDLESIQSSSRDELSGDTSIWSEMFEDKSPAFLVVGYGATRRVETLENFDFGTRRRRVLRYQRVQGLFEDSYSLIPLGSWLPKLETVNPNRHREIVQLIDKLLPEPFSFSGYFESGEYLFLQEKIMVPFDALSDGYRSYIGWITDLLFHIFRGCPEDRALSDTKGIVMVDEIDLHLHPAWQREVVSIISRAFPNLQFIFTTHSPIVTGSLESQNIVVLEMKGSRSKILRLSRSAYGLNADQVLLSEYFGLDSSRAPGIRKKMRELNMKALEGDPDASLQLLKYLAEGEEARPKQEEDDPL